MEDLLVYQKQGTDIDFNFSGLTPIKITDAGAAFQLPPKFEQMPEVSNGCEVIFNVPMYDYVDD